MHQTSNSVRTDQSNEVVYIPRIIRPSKWSGRDRRAVSSAVGMGVFMGLLVWSAFMGLLGGISLIVVGGL